MRLTPTERVLAWRLVRHALVTRDELLVAAWGWDRGDGKCLDVAMHKLRRKLGERGMIQATSGVGYSVKDRLALQEILIRELFTSGVCSRRDELRKGLRHGVHLDDGSDSTDQRL